MSGTAEDGREYNVVVNHEEQYSIWFKDRELPAGWRIVEIPDSWREQYQSGLSDEERQQPGNKRECLAYIEAVWTDMRPLSLRKKMQAAG